MSKRPMTLRTLAAGALASLVLAGAAAAKEHVYPLTSETYRTECGACHARANQGDYGERSLRVPR